MSLPHELTGDEWSQLLLVMSNTRFLSTIEKLRASHNLPQLPHDIFEDRHDYNQGEQSFNAVLSRLNVPFHLKRFGSIAGPRTMRRLAIVRWRYARQLRMPIDTGMKRYRRYR